MDRLMTRVLERQQADAFRIEIGEGLTAVALSHHLAYGTVPGGSCSRYTQFVMIKEEKQTLLCKETVR
jgi:hypothetical protein